VSSAHDRVFLDANALFSAAWREDSALVRLWTCQGLVLLTSTYAAEEARRNLDTPAQRDRLAAHMASVDVMPHIPAGALPEDIALPEKDRPILLAAIGARATHLLTGDVRHFGALYGRLILGVSVLRPGDYRCP
jgi:predicted nucleic acid-binding protein